MFKNFLIKIKLNSMRSRLKKIIDNMTYLENYKIIKIVKVLINLQLYNSNI
jgi:hypothetical protein